MNLTNIPLNKLSSSAQPRPLLTAEVDKLAASIRDVGLIQPITVCAGTHVSGIAEDGFQIVAGHHRVAACRALGWTEVAAIVINDASHLQTELIEIDENLCRAELTASQRTGYTNRRKQIWEALHPRPKMSPMFAAVFGQELADSAVVCDGDGVPVELEVEPLVPLQVSAHGGARPHPLNFAASTAKATGMTKQAINRHIARADALGEVALTKVTNTSLDSGVELDALAKMPAPERAALIERAAAGEQVSARQQAPAASAKPVANGTTFPIRLFRAVQALLGAMGCKSAAQLVDDINSLPELTQEEQETLEAALSDLADIGATALTLN